MRRAPRLDHTTLAELIERTYAASLQTDLWPGVLTTLADTLGGASGLLVHHDLKTQGAVAATVRVDPDSVREYNEHYHRIDAWAISAHARLAAPGRVMVDHALAPREALRRTEFFNDFLMRFDTPQMVTVGLSRHANVFSALSIFRGRRDAPFGAAEEALLNVLAPHLMRAFDIHRRLANVVGERDAARQALDVLPQAVLFVDGRAQLVDANEAARSLLLRRSGLTVRGRVLVAERPDETRRLHTACAEVARSGEGVHHSGRTLVVARHNSPLPLQVLVVRVPPAAAFDSVGTRAAAMIFVSDPAVDQPPNEFMLRVFYRLTPLEAKVAALLALGQSLELIAQDLLLTRETVRWYSKQVLSKVGCRSRSELVRRLSTTLAGTFSGTILP